MRPPECAICGVRFEPGSEGDVVAFLHSADDPWSQRRERHSLPEHPPNVEWFCAAHLDRARELKELPLGEALRRMDESSALDR